MKNSIFLTSFILSIVFLSTSVKAQDSLKVDTLVAYYPFNGDVSDSSGFENHGEVFGATLTEDRFGNPNSAYNFDGIDDYLKVNDADQLTPTESRWSFSVWFKTEFPGDKFIFYKGSSTSNREYASGVRIDSLGSFQINENGSATNRDGVVTSTKIKENIWNHLVGVWDSSTTKIYLNNKLENIDSTNLSISNLSSDLYIGTYGGGITQYAFNGEIDDLRLYNSALDSNSVDELFHQGGWPLPEDSTIAPNDTLVAYYPFNGNANDKSSFGNDGEVFGATLTEDRFGNANSAYEFDGNNDYVWLGDAEALSPENITVSAWFNSESQKLGNPITQFIIRNRLWGYSISFNPLMFGTTPHIGGIVSIVSLDDSGSQYRFQSTETSYNDGKWHFLSFTYNSNEFKFYIDGEKVFQDSTQGANRPIYYEPGGTSIGRGGDAANNHFEGKIDDVRIYNYALSDSLIWDLYTEGGWPLPEDTTIVPNDTLAAYFPFNGDASDSSGYGNHGKVFGAELSSDRFGREGFAYRFDGIDDFIEIQNPAMLHSGKNLSMSFWAKGISQDTTFKGLISKNNMQPFGIAIDDGGRILFTISDKGIPLNMVVNNLNIDPEEWYQYVAVFRADEYMRLFQNGTEIGTLYGSIPSNMDVTSESILFGATSITTESKKDTMFFKGHIDDIRFYNYDLNPDEVNNLFVNESKLPVNIERISEVPNVYTLYQNYPNPFNPSTTIRFDLPEQSNISLRVYDITGKLVANLVDGLKSAGSHQFSFDASGLASGIYFYELRTNEFSDIRKFTLIK